MIVGVAIKCRLTCSVFSMPKPARHDSVIKRLFQLGQYKHCRGEQGFVNENGTFFTRAQAMEHCLAIGQHVAGARSGILFSEDVW